VFLVDIDGLFRGVVTEKQDAELFFVDTGKESEVVPAGVMRARKPQFTLKIDEILQPDSAVAARKRATRIPPKKTVDDLLVQRKLKSGTSINKSATKSKEKSAIYDAWADEASPKPKKGISALVAPSSVIKSLPSSVVSYNPVAEEHLAHLQELEIAEIGRLDEIEADLKNAPRFKHTITDSSVTDCMEEANKRLLENLDDDPEDPIDGEEQASNPVLFTFKTSSRPKTKAVRNRQRRHRLLLSQQRSNAAERLLLKQIASLEPVNGSVRDDEHLIKVPVEEKELIVEALLQESRLKRVRSLLPLKPLSIKLPEELPGSMRLLSAEGNMISDQFRSLVERGIVEPTAGLSRVVADSYYGKVGRRRQAHKVVERSSFKFWE